MRLFWARELTDYPSTSRRMWLLMMAVLATVVASFEASISPVVPLLLEDLHMSLSTYGLIAAVSVLAGAASAMIGGRLCDLWGRVTLLVPALFVTALMDFAMLLVHSPTDLFIVRAALSFVEGFAVSTTAGLVRDFTPRVGRATGYGFWTWGPVGANFLAAAVAGATLPIFGTWQSQFVIIGSFALVCSAVIATAMADISPALRAQVIENVESLRERAAAEAEPVKAQARELFRYPQMWAHILGVTSWLVLYETLNVYGPTLIVEEFGISAAKASTVFAFFWTLNIATLVGAGIISDRLRLRKPISCFGAVASGIVLVYFITLFGQSPPIGLLMATGAVLGGLMGIAYGPWMANFSEDAEDIRPSLQGTAWGVWGMSVRIMIVVLLFVSPLVVEATGSWRVWMIIALVFELLYVPAMFAFKGPWRRAVTVTPAETAPASSR